jgi:hypothetical protein
MPQRGFCCKGLCTKTSVFAPQFHDQEILQLDLHGKAWRSVRFENWIAWRTSKILCADHNVMTKFICADFNGQSENGYPGIEVAEAWNVYNSADENDNREGALMQVTTHQISQPPFRIPVDWGQVSIGLTPNVVNIMLTSIDFVLFQWLLCPGQIMKFRCIPSVGDKPGTLSAHAVTKSVVMLRGQKSISRFPD